MTAQYPSVSPLAGSTEAHHSIHYEMKTLRNNHRESVFLLSEHILCKEGIVIVKKFDFEIFTYLYVLRSPEFIYAILGVMYVCVCM